MKNKRFPNYPDDTDYTTNAPSYYDDLARKQKLIQLLAEKIWEYDERLDNRITDLEEVLSSYLSQWDERIENLDDEVSHIFVTWLNDGTLEQIINHDVLGNKADKSYVDDLNETVTIQLKQTMINAKNFGVIGDGVTDDTTAINQLLVTMKENGYTHLYFPAGVYMINATGTDDGFPAGTRNGGLIIDFPVTVTLDTNATLKALPSNKVGYVIFNIINTNGVTIQGGKIIGERYEHQGTGGEFGFGVSIKGSHDILIQDTTISEFWGDSIFLGYDNPITRNNYNIYIKRVTMDNSRRQGVSIVNGKNIFISECIIKNINGTAPQSAIDIEPDGESGIVTDVFIHNNFFDNNETSDIVIGGGNGCERVHIADNTMMGAGNISVIIQGTATHTTRDVMVSNNIIKPRLGKTSINIGRATLVTIAQNTMDGGVNGSTENGTGIVISTGATNTVIAKNIIANQMYGIQFYSAVSNIDVDGNTITDVLTGILFAVECSKITLKNNILKNCAKYGIFSRLLNSEVVGNSFSNITDSAMYSYVKKSRIAMNTFEQVGTKGYATTNILSFDNALADECIFDNNVFKLGVSTQKAIMILNTPTLPHIIANNIIPIGANSFNVPANTRQINNLLAT